MHSPVYLDHAATTPTDPRVLEAMLPYFLEQPGNAASRTHAYGWFAEEAVATARRQLADLIGADPREIVFTSGATEAINLGIKGVFEAYRRKGAHLVTVQTEHSAVLDTCRHLEKQGAMVTYLPVDAAGRLRIADLEAAIRPDTVLVAVMWANNETGVLQDMAAIGEVCTRHGVWLLSDATQAVGKVVVHPRSCQVHLMALSAHKLYGPKGVGALYVSRQNPAVEVVAQLDGGGHERGRRSGTLNVPGIVGLGKAAELAATELATEATRLATLRDHLETELTQRLTDAHVNGSTLHRLPHLSNISFGGTDSEQVMMAFNTRLAVSSGAACTSAALEPSHVLLAMGYPPEHAHAALRFSLGRFTTPDAITSAIAWVEQAVQERRNIR
jgi:cysteine desulfurase